MIFQQVKNVAKSGTLLPGTNYTVKGLGKSRGGEKILVYLIRNKTGSGTPSEKNVTESEFERAYKELVDKGEFSRKWFVANFGPRAKADPCNFCVIGAVFILFGTAIRGHGKYILRSQPNLAQPSNG